jgi:hypothetical protein
MKIVFNSRLLQNSGCCHPERSEGSYPCCKLKILRCAQNDKMRKDEFYKSLTR